MKETAGLLGWSIANVKVRLFRSKKKLHKVLTWDIDEGRSWEDEKKRGCSGEAWRSHAERLPGREKVAIDEGWQGRLMARVRQVGGVEGKPRFLPAFERLVWKLVPISLPMSVGMVFLLAPTLRYRSLRWGTALCQVRRGIDPKKDPWRIGRRT